MTPAALLARLQAEEALADFVFLEGDIVAQRAFRAWPRVPREGEAPVGLPDDVAAALAAWWAAVTYDAADWAARAGVTPRDFRRHERLLVANRMVYPDGTCHRAVGVALAAAMSERTGLARSQARRGGR